MKGEYVWLISMADHPNGVKKKENENRETASSNETLSCIPFTDNWF